MRILSSLPLTLFINYFLMLSFIFLVGSSTTQAKELEEQDKQMKLTVAQKVKKKTGETIQNSMENIAFIQQALESLQEGIENSKESSSLNRNSVKTIKEGLKSIDEKLKEAYADLEESRTSITTNAGSLKKLNTDLRALLRDIRANASDLGSQKSLIEDNSIRLYEILILISQTDEKIAEFSQALSIVKHTDQTKEIRIAFNKELNRLWRLLMTMMIIFIPIAFVLASDRIHYKRLNDGTEQQQGVLLVSLSAFLAYFAFGFGLTYGTTASGWVGTTNYLLPIVDAKITPLFPFAEFMFYKSGGILLAALIIYLAVGRQLASFGHMLLALFVGGFLIPLFNHWIGAGQFIADNIGWLEGSGFRDQAMVTTTSLITAFFAFIVVWRLGHFSPLKNEDVEHAFDYPIYSASAALLLWLSWFSFTTGLLEFAGTKISLVMLNVSLAAMTGGLTAFLHYVFFHADKSSMARALAGFITGLVAIAACAQSVSFVEAMAIGAGAGLLQNMAYSLLRRLFLKQAWQARAAYLVAIHGIGGIWGLLCVALLGTKGTFASPDMLQLIEQFQVMVIAIIYSVLFANGVFMMMRFRKKPTPTI